MRAIQLTEKIAGQDILADGISVNIGFAGIEVGGTYTRDGTMYYGWDTGQFIGTAPFSAIERVNNGAGLTTMFSASLTGTKFLTAGRMRRSERDGAFENQSAAINATAGKITGSFGKASGGQLFIKGGISTPGLGIGGGPSNNTKIRLFRGPFQW